MQPSVILRTDNIMSVPQYHPLFCCHFRQAAPSEKGRYMNKDIAEKRLEACNDVFADIFNNLVFGGHTVLAENQLSPLPTESFSRMEDGSLRQGTRDILKTNQTNERYRLICGLENQTGRDNTMPQRVMGYDFAAYEEQIRQIMKANRAAGTPAYGKRIHDFQKLAPVITVVLFYGSEIWTLPHCLHDMLEFPHDHEHLIKPYVANYPLNLVCVSKLPPEVRGRLTSDFRLIAEYLACKDDKEQLEAVMADQFHTIRHPEEFLDALSAISGDPRYRKLAQDLKDHLKENDTCQQNNLRKEHFTMYMIAEELENRGIERGIEQGIRAMIQLCADLNLPRTQTSDNLIRRFQLSPEKAEAFLEKYW